MNRFQKPVPRSDEPSDAIRVSRRGFLRAGGLVGVGLNSAAIPTLATDPPRSAAGPALKFCIQIFCNGGPSHLDTFDMKPGAPSEVRGEFQPISTSLPGFQICEHLPMTAKVAHHLAVIRSMQHRMRGHRSGVTNALCGLPPPAGDVGDQQNEWYWDDHKHNFSGHKRKLAPFDRAFSALIGELDERGLLGSTLVMTLGEFGRTPKINADAGRDHWPDCYCAVLAGGGVHAGQIYGASDKNGAYPVSDPVGPADLAATLFSRFGFDPATEIFDHAGRPFRLAEGRPIAGLFGDPA